MTYNGLFTADRPAGSNRRMMYLTRIRGVDDGMFKTFDLPECGQVKDLSLIHI